MVNRTLSFPIILILTMLVFLAGMFNLVAHGLWLDEGYSLFFANASGSDFIRYVHEMDGPIAPYYGVMWFLFHLGGNHLGSLVTGRFFTLVIGVMNIPMIYLIARKMFNSTQIGLLSAIILSTSTLFWAELTSIRVYSLALLLAMISFYWFINARSSIGPAFVNVLLFSLHIPFGLSIAALEFGLLIYQKRSRLALVDFAVINVFGMGAVVELFRHLGATHSVWLPKLYPMWVAGNILGLSGPNIREFPALFSHPMVWLIMPLLFLSWRYSGLHQKPQWFTLMAWVVLPVIITLCISVVRPIFVVRYFLESLIPLSILMAVALTRLPHRVWRYSAIIVVIAMQIFVTYKLNSEPHEDWTAMAWALQNHTHPGDTVTFTWDDNEVALLADLRNRHKSLNAQIYPPIGSDWTQLKEGVTPVSPNTTSQTIWVVSRTTWIPSAKSNLKVSIPSQFHQCEVNYLPNNIIDVVVFSKRCSIKDVF